MRSLGVVARPVLAASYALWLSLGCLGGQSGAEGPGVEDPGGELPGTAECAVDVDCLDPLASELESLEQSGLVSVEITGSRCELLSVSTDFESVSGNTCYCDKADGGELTLGPAGLGCHLIGRNGECIFGDADFTTCDPSDADACTAACEEAAGRIETDAARPIATELILSECRESHCESVVSLDGLCYANRGWLFGRSFDCSLGAEAILQASAEALTLPPLVPVREDETPYRSGTIGTLRLETSEEWYGSERAYASFGASAQFFEVGAGTGAEQLDVIDPLQGIDDCGVFRQGSAGVSPSLDFESVERAVLRDSGIEHALEEFASGTSTFPFYSYGVDLLAAGVAPRHGQSYGFAASGGTSGAAIDIDGIVLPEALSLPDLQQLRRTEKGALDLRWEGRGAGPLRASFLFNLSSLEIECRLRDDGAFQVPAEILDAAPDGFVLASFRRENRSIINSGGQSVQAIAASSATHRFVLGPACDGTASMAACQASADAIATSYTACGVEPPPRATLCPDYLSEACGTCPEYFECLAQGTRCGEAGLSTGSGCSCP
jgi:hypothetical protein